MNAPERIIPERFDVSLPVTQAITVNLKLADGALATAQSYEIDSNDMAQIVADQRNTFLKNITTIKELKKGFVAPAKVIIANAEALFDPALDELDASVKHLNAGLLTWDQKEKERMAKEKAEREAEERRIRQKAEQEAAAARAKAEDEAREARRKAEEAEEKRQQAIREGNAKEAARLAAESAKQEEKAAAAIENGNAKAAEAQMHATAIAAAAPAPEPVKIAGNSFRKNWIAEIKPGLNEAAVKTMIATAAVNGRPELLALLDLNMSQCNKLAKAYEAAANIPGMVTRDAPVTAGSRK